MCVNLMSHTVGTTLLLLSSHVAGGGTAPPPRRPTQFDTGQANIAASGRPQAEETVEVVRFSSRTHAFEQVDHQRAHVTMCAAVRTTCRRYSIQMERITLSSMITSVLKSGLIAGGRESKE